MFCKFIIWMALASISSEFVSAATDKVVCYHGTWSKYRKGNGEFGVANIDPNLCTHLIYGFVGLSNNKNGSVVHLDEWLNIGLGNFKAFNELKQKNPNLKTLLAIGGWSEGSIKYSAVAASPQLRAIFIESALNMVQTYGFDGFDLDWEYPAQRGGSASDVENFAILLKEFREVFDQHNLLLSAAVGATTATIEVSYDVPSLSKYLDFINVMSYDLRGSWDEAVGHNAPLYASSTDTTAKDKTLNIDAIVKGWIAYGADPQKIVLGLPFYGRTFTLADQNNVAVGAPASGPGQAGPYTQEAGMLGYNEIVEKQAEGGWTIVWDEEQKVPHMYKGNQWIGYDDPTAIALKVEYAKSANLGGVMVWSLETDDFLGLSGTKFALLTAANEALGRNTTTPSSNASAGAPSNKSPDQSSSPGSSASARDKKSSSNRVSPDASSVCTKEGYVSDSNDCTTFYYCKLVAGKYLATTNKCPSGLYFDAASEVCNWPDLVSGC